MKGDYVKKRKKIAQYSMDMVLIAVYDTMTKASEENGIHTGEICEVCKFRKGRKSAGGFIWRYYDEKDEKND